MLQCQRHRLDPHIQHLECIGTLCRYHNTAGVRSGHRRLCGCWAVPNHPAAGRHSTAQTFRRYGHRSAKKVPGSMWELILASGWGKISPDESLVQIPAVTSRLARILYSVVPIKIPSSSGWFRPTCPANSPPPYFCLRASQTPLF